MTKTFDSIGLDSCHDITAATLLNQDKEVAAILVDQTINWGFECNVTQMLRL